MEVWVRSQSKNIFVCIKCVCYDRISLNEHAILGDNHWVLGRYGTQERCLEIIDEIQSLFGYILLGSVSANGGVKKEYHQRDTAVYEMPKE